MTTGSFDADTFISRKRAELSRVRGRVLALLSGGVDSTTSARLLMEAGVMLRPIHLVTGFQREHETHDVVQSLSPIGLAPEVIDRTDYFLSGVRGQAEPDAKRAAFRELYFGCLIDIMETSSEKSILHGTQQHVTSGRPGHTSPTSEFLKRQYQIIEPVKGLSKAQVRAVAAKLNVPPSIIWRRPFPGPALLLRFGGSLDDTKLSLVRRATKIVDDFVRENAEAFTDCYQIFPYLGDGARLMALSATRTAIQGYPLYIRAVERVAGCTDSAMDVFALSVDVQARLVEALMSLDGVSRILWDVTPKRAHEADVKTAGIEYI